MQSSQQTRANSSGLVAALLAALGATSAIPIGLAQLDYAGLIGAFGVDPGDTPHGVVVLAGIGGVLTLCVIALAYVGSALCLAGSRSARTILLGAAIAGFATGLVFWLPAGIAIGGAALLSEPRGRAGAAPI